jgi:hypothetical protein
MRFAVFKGEKSITDLAKRLFRLQGRGSQAATKQAADALLKANPQLSNISEVPAGSLIALPDTAPPLHPDEQTVVPGLVRAFAVETVQSAFDWLHQRLSEIEAMAADKVKSGMERLQAPEVKAASTMVAEQHAILAETLPNIDSVAQDTEEILKDLQAVQEARKQSLTQVRAALASFAKS